MNRIPGVFPAESRSMEKPCGELRVNEPAKQDAWEWFPIDQLPKHIYSPSKKFIDAYCMAENRCVRTMNAEGEGYEAV